MDGWTGCNVLVRCRDRAPTDQHLSAYCRDRVVAIGNSRRRVEQPERNARGGDKIRRRPDVLSTARRVVGIVLDELSRLTDGWSLPSTTGHRLSGTSQTVPTRGHSRPILQPLGTAIRILRTEENRRSDSRSVKVKVKARRHPLPLDSALWMPDGASSLHVGVSER